jgi:hypothetical protein
MNAHADPVLAIAARRMLARSPRLPLPVFGYALARLNGGKIRRRDALAIAREIGAVTIPAGSGDDILVILPPLPAAPARVLAPENASARKRTA